MWKNTIVNDLVNYCDIEVGGKETWGCSNWSLCHEEEIPSNVHHLVNLIAVEMKIWAGL